MTQTRTRTSAPRRRKDQRPGAGYSRHLQFFRRAMLAKARELNARWLEEISTNPNALPDSAARYHVCKQIEAPAPAETVGLLEAA